MRIYHSLLAAIVIAVAASGAHAASMAHRIVSTNLCTDEYLFRLVAPGRIAALSILAGARHPQVSTIAGKIGSIALIRPNAEEVLNSRPDVVLLFQGVNPRLYQQLRAASVPVLEVPWAQSLSQIRAVTRRLGDALGVRARAAELVARMDHELAAARALAPRTPVSALIYEPNGYAESGAIVQALMADAGLHNAAPQLVHSRQGTIPIEAVIAAAPRLLILNSAPEVAPALAQVALSQPALAALHGRTRIVHVDLRGLLCPGPWLGRTALRLARLARAGRGR